VVLAWTRTKGRKGGAKGERRARQLFIASHARSQQGQGDSRGGTRRAWNPPPGDASRSHDASVIVGMSGLVSANRGWGRGRKLAHPASNLPRAKQAQPPTGCGVDAAAITLFPPSPHGVRWT